MAYITGEEFLSRYDSRTIAELISDTGTPAESVASSSVLLNALEDAAATIRMAARVSDRYESLDLDNIAADATNRYQLQRLNADLAVGYLCRRRMMPPDKVAAMAPGYDEAQEILELLRRGERIFDIEEVAAAGVKVENIVPESPVALLSDFRRFFGTTPIGLDRDGL